MNYMSTKIDSDVDKHIDWLQKIWNENRKTTFWIDLTPNRTAIGIIICFNDPKLKLSFLEKKNFDKSQILESIRTINYSEITGARVQSFDNPLELDTKIDKILLEIRKISENLLGDKL